MLYIEMSGDFCFGILLVEVSTCLHPIGRPYIWQALGTVGWSTPMRRCWNVWHWWLGGMCLHEGCSVSSSIFFECSQFIPIHYTCTLTKKAGCEMDKSTLQFRVYLAPCSLHFKMHRLALFTIFVAVANVTWAQVEVRTLYCLLYLWCINIHCVRVRLIVVLLSLHLPVFDFVYALNILQLLTSMCNIICEINSDHIIKNIKKTLCFVKEIMFSTATHVCTLALLLDNHICFLSWHYPNSLFSKKIRGPPEHAHVVIHYIFWLNHFWEVTIYF